MSRLPVPRPIGYASCRNSLVPAGARRSRRGAVRLLAPLLLLCAARASSPRETTLFDFGWRFHLGDPPHAEAPAFDDSAWRTLDLPHDWSIEGPYDPQAAAGGTGGYLPTGIGWYRKAFTLPAEASGRRIALRFDGVYQHSTVWINGHELGFRPYGYATFQYDLTPYVTFGPAGNTIAVRVDNSQQPGSRWYSGSGIFRHTWLLVTDRLHADPDDISVTTPVVSKDVATLRVRARVHNGRPTTEPVELRLALVDPAGRPAASAPVRGSGGPPAASLEAGAEAELEGLLILPAPQLWSPDAPALYRLRTEIVAGGGVVDSVETAVGVRTAEFDVNRGLLINGQPVKLRGFCLHQDGGAVGSAVPDSLLEHRIGLLKEMGCNAIRCSHNPMAPEFYAICDRLGMLVMDEAFDEWTIRKPQIKFGYSDYFRDWYDRDVTDLVRRDRNHPSVILWNAGNEIGEQGAPSGPEVLRKLIAVFRREDPTRPVTVAMDNIFNQNGPAPEAFTGQLDIVGYNYPDRWGSRRETQYGDDRELHPARRFVGTEVTGIPETRGVYPFGSLLDDNDSDDHLQLGDGPSGALYVASTMRASSLWRFVALHPYVTGEFIWTGFDYLGESRWPQKAASFAPLDTCGFKKDAFYFYQSLWVDSPVLHLLPHWNWPGREGTAVPVVAYTNCAAVELFLNGRSMGLKAKDFPGYGVEGAWNTYAQPKVEATTSDLQLVWDVPYAPGALTAVGYDRRGKVVARAEVRTARAPAVLELTPDRGTLVAGAREVASVQVRALDADGTFVPDAANAVTFDLSGPARLIGVDNGDPQSHAAYQGRERSLFNGMALALVESAREAGTVRLTAHASGLPDATVDIAVLAPR
jgi:beta-galactosidase